MELKVIRYSHGINDTLGLLFIDGKFICYTIEDEKRIDKIKGETRISNGTYKIKLRTEGGFHKRYLRKFPDIHEGMLHITNVPGFDYILIHCGNTEKDTEGCLLVGNTSKQNITDFGFIGDSVKAYKRIYPKILKALKNNEKVIIKYEHLG